MAKVKGCQSNIEELRDYFDEETKAVFGSKHMQRLEENMHTMVNAIDDYNLLLKTVVEPVLCSEWGDV
jgi:hypothetical protein